MNSFLLVAALLSNFPAQRAAYELVDFDSVSSAVVTTQESDKRPIQIASRISIATYMAGQFTDGIVSAYGFGAGTLIELNPVLSWAEDRPVAFGLVKATVASGVAYILVKMSRNHPVAALITGAALTGIQGYITYRNYREMRK